MSAESLKINLIVDGLVEHILQNPERFTRVAVAYAQTIETLRTRHAAHYDMPCCDEA